MDFHERTFVLLQQKYSRQPFEFSKKSGSKNMPPCFTITTAKYKLRRQKKNHCFRGSVKFVGKTRLCSRKKGKEKERKELEKRD